MDTTQKTREEIHRPKDADAPRKPRTAAPEGNRSAPKRRLVFQIPQHFLFATAFSGKISEKGKDASDKALISLV